ncbi:MAG: N-acetylornithine carbamoyltransferase [Bacteroidia bacterium]|nr:N-acetylornithine carbamoyltransferase [Bacteroidia bacterium]
MHHFTALADVPDLGALLETAEAVSRHPHSTPALGRHKTLGLIFFNPSLRTRLSSQRAAHNLGLDVMVLNAGTEGWALEFGDGAIMDGDKAEHIKDAAAVMGRYCDILGVRTFPGLKDREADYQEEVLEAFKRYAGVPILSLESATRHPLQSLADLITIRMHTPVPKPKVVLTWAPHVRALPQAVPNSFAEWMNGAAAAGQVEFVITHPPGYELAPAFAGSAPIVYDQHKAFEGAHVIYAKNWSSYTDYGKILIQSREWMVTPDKMALTDQAKFMHCLPVRRNVVVADAVIDSPASIILDQAANRVVSCQAVLQHMLMG